MKAKLVVIMLVVLLLFSPADKTHILHISKLQYLKVKKFFFEILNF